MQGGPCALCQDLEDFDRGYQAILESLAEQRRSILQKINERHDPFIQRLPLESSLFAYLDKFSTKNQSISHFCGIIRKG